MGEPKYRIQENKRTGEHRELVSHDGGRTWKLDSTSGPIETHVEADAPNGQPTTGATWRPATELPEQRSGVTESAQQFRPSEFTAPSQRGMGDLRMHESQLPKIEVGMGEAVSREVGGDIGAGFGDRLRGADRAAHNRETERLGGIPVQRGRGFSPESQKLKSADDYVLEEMARRKAGQQQHPKATMAANLGATAAQAIATPAFRGAGLGGKLLAGAGNIAADTAVAGGTAALTAAPGDEVGAARRAATPAALLSTALRTPGAIKGGVVAARNAATDMLPPETARAAREFTDLGETGRAARQAARAGQRDLDPQVRKITALGSDIEATRDQLLNWARTGGTKKRAIQDAMERDAGAGDVVIPKAPRPAPDIHLDIDDAAYARGEKDVYRVKETAAGRGGPAGVGVTGRPGRGGRGAGKTRIEPEQALAGDDIVENLSTRRASPPPAGFQPARSISEAGAFAEQQTLQLEGMLANADDLGPASRQAIRKLKELSQSTQDKITEALGASGDDAAGAAADAYHALDLYKQRLGQFSKNLGGGADNRLTQQQLRQMYDDVRNALEREDVAGPTMAGSQKRVNAAWTDELTQRDRYENTMLTSDAAKRGADPFEDLHEADPRKVHGVLSNAGAATNDLAERSMREGMGATSRLVRSLADEYHAPPELRQKATQLAGQVDELLAEFEGVKTNLSRAREAREVASASGIVGKGINTVGAIEEAVRNSPLGRKAAGVVATLAGYTGKMAEPARKATAMQVGSNAAARGQASENGLDDEKYGPLLSSKQGKDREAAYSLLLAQDPGFRARQRAKAAQAEGETGQ